MEVLLLKRELFYITNEFREYVFELGLLLPYVPFLMCMFNTYPIFSMISYWILFLMFYLLTKDILDKLDNIRVVAYEPDIETEMIQEINLDILEDVKVVLSAIEFEKIIITEESENGLECLICSEKKKILSKIKNCNHTFCKECIKTWLTEYNVKCPVCRNDCRVAI